MASPTVDGSNSGNNQSAATSQTANLPASGMGAGKLAIILVSHSDTTSGQVTITGWTRFFEALNTAGSIACLTGFYRWLDGSEGSSVSVAFASSSRIAYASYVFGGAQNPATQAPEATTGTTNNTATPDPPAITPTGGSKDYLFLAAFASSHGRITSALPAGYGTSVGSGPNNGTTTNKGIGSGSKAVTASSENPGTFTTTGTGVEETGYATIAVHPGPAAAAGVFSSAQAMLHDDPFSLQVITVPPFRTANW